MKSQLEKILARVETVIPEEELKKKLSKKKPLRVKLGIDPTAPDIHLGFAVVLRKLRDFQELGHIAVLVVGDFTARIGDPSGLSKTRPPLTEEDVKKNMKNYEKQIFKILDNKNTEIRHNSKWLAKLTPTEIVKLTSRITMAKMMERDDFSKRFKEEQPIALHEFLYPVFQAYDSVAVRSDIELGGTDQHWNHLLGRDMQRSFDMEPQVVMLMPILEGLDGVRKMSKSYGNYVGVAESPKEQFGKLMSIPDNLILRYFKLCLDYDENHLRNIEKKLKAGENPRDIKMELAEGVVSLYHNKKAGEEARKEFIKVFSENKTPAGIKELKIDKGEKIWIVELIEKAGFVKSRGEARRLITSGALKIDGKKVTDFTLNISFDKDTVLKVGKLRFVKIKPK
ncbi:tyrosine--tRNA ligase [candidate division WOR-3 bacterium]|nr:tyrosine--tRNA ligase [candidate division WOR-3 bacterium]